MVELLRFLEDEQRYLRDHTLHHQHGINAIKPKKPTYPKLKKYMKDVGFPK